MNDWLQKVEDAKKELGAKTLDQIQQETAIKWASRYAAAIELGRTDDAHEYRSEALEHASQVHDEMFYATMRVLIG